MAPKLIAFAWLLTTLVVVGYPLAAGRIRFGGPGSEPIERRVEPRRFWTTYALSTGLFLVVTGVVAWLVLPIVSR